MGLEMSEIIPKIWIERRFDASNSSDFPTLDLFLLKNKNQNQNNKTPKNPTTTPKKPQTQTNKKNRNGALLKACSESQQYESKDAFLSVFSKYERMKFDQCFYRIGMHVYFCFESLGLSGLPLARMISTVDVGSSLQTSDYREEGQPQSPHCAYLSGCAEGSFKGSGWAAGDYPVLENGASYN